jgi:GWxTD domain-containing protein
MRTLPFVLIGVLMAAALSAPALSAPPPQPLKIVVDFARFRGDSGNAFVELYYAVPQQSLTYVPDSAGSHAGAEITLAITRPDGSLLGDRWLVPHRRQTGDQGEPGMDLVGLYPLMLPPGDYRVAIVARDAADRTRKDSVALTIPVKPLDTTRIVLSDIELAMTIRPGKAGAQFYKNTLEVLPNVEGVTGEHAGPWYYAEAYGLLSRPDRSDLTLRLSVLDALGKEVVSREKLRKRSAESSVFVDNVNVQELRSGTYTLVLALLDSGRRVLSSAGKKFFVFNPRLGVDSSLRIGDAQLAMSVFSRMDEAELDREFSWLRYHSTDPEKKQYKSLTGADTKRKFLFEFWERRTPGSRSGFLERVDYANRTFKSMGREGYLTDRGRVYITYGAPDDIDRHPSKAEMRPLEIWTYNAIQSGVIFVFVQRQLGGDLELVHSTHRNELHDENWERFAQEQ